MHGTYNVKMIYDYLGQVWFYIERRLLHFTNGTFPLPAFLYSGPPVILVRACMKI